MSLRHRTVPSEFNNEDDCRSPTFFVMDAENTKHEDFHTPLPNTPARPRLLRTPIASENPNRQRPCTSQTDPPLPVKTLTFSDEVDRLKLEIQSQDKTINEQAELIHKLRTKQASDAGLLKETSNKLIADESKQRSVNTERLQAELEKANKMSRRRGDELVAEQSRNRDLEREIESKNEKLEELKDEIQTLKDEIQNLKKKELESQRRETNLRHEFSAADMDSKGIISNLEAKLHNTKESIREQRAKIASLEKQIAELKKLLDDAKDEERRKSDEVRRREGVLAKKETELVVRRSLDVGLQHLNSNLGDQLLNTLNAHFISIQPHCQTVDLIKLGSLTTANNFLSQQVVELKQKEDSLEKELRTAREQASSAKADLEELQKKLVDIEGNAEMTHAFLVEESNKVKNQKAELRGELMMLKRDNARLQEDLQKMRLCEADQSQLEIVREQLATANMDRESAEKTARESREKIRGMEESIGELEAKLVEEREKGQQFVGSCAEIENLKERVLAEGRKNAVLVKGITELNDQVEAVLTQKKRIEARLTRAKEELMKSNDELRMKDRALEGVKRAEAEMATLVNENDRLKARIDFLQGEMRENLTDFHDQMSKMAQRCSEATAAKTNDREGLVAKVDDLKRENGQLESQIRASKRQIEELKQDNVKLSEQITEVTQRDRSTNEENAQLREALVDAVGKAERFKSEAVEAKDSSQQLRDDWERLTKKVRDLENEISDLNGEIRDKDRLVGFLQGQTNAHKMPRLKSKPKLLSQPSDSSLEELYPEIVELENEKVLLREELEKRKQELNVRKNSAETVGENSSGHPQPSAPMPTPGRAPGRSPLKAMQSAPNIRSPASMKESNASTGSSGKIGRMRHDIPHKWRSQLGFGLRQMQCCMCFEGIPRVGYAMRCSECEVVVHKHCTSRVTNTCGFPAHFAQFYHDNNRVSKSTEMNGWVRLYSNSDPQWRSLYARMHKNNLSFYDDDALADNLTRPFLSIDLDKTQWSVRAMGEGPNGERDGYARCVQVRTGSNAFYMLCPTDDSTARWTGALQTAASDRHYLTRRASSFTTSSLLMALDSPRNLTINCTLVLDDWLLIGAQEGLFATKLSDPRSPFLIPGVAAVHAMETLFDLDLLGCVLGKQRELCLISTSNLRRELTGRQPAIKPQPITGFDYVHLLACHQEGNHKFLLAADTQKIHILQYKRDFFTAHMALNTIEPVTCIKSAHGGVYFGADSFYFVHSLSLGTPTVNLLMTSHVADFPLAVLETGPQEVLLAYQNYGIFVNSRGEKTREAMVEWEHTPLEFIYTAPYLYIVHFDSLDIAEVYQNTGLNSKTISEDHEVFRAEQAHIVGTRKGQEVFVVTANSKRVEIHTFNACQKRNGSKRRALASAFSMASLDKRSKTQLEL